MKKTAICIVLFICLAAGCSRVNLPPPSLGPTGLQAQPTPLPTPATPTPLITATTPPTTAPKVNATSASSQSTADNTVTKAMRRDIDQLIARSTDQQGQEENYKNQKKEQYLTVESVTGKSLKFAGKPQVFTGDYTGQLTQGKKYKYFEDASMGGKRYYNVKDNFGVWIVFQYQDPNFK